MLLGKEQELLEMDQSVQVLREEASALCVFHSLKPMECYSSVGAVCS